MIGALIHTAITIGAIIAVHFSPVPTDLMWAVLAFWYAREMRDSQRERQDHGIGHRNTFHAVDLIPGISPFRIGTLADWLMPAAAVVGYTVYIIVS